MSHGTQLAQYHDGTAVGPEEGVEAGRMGKRGGGGGGEGGATDSATHDRLQARQEFDKVFSFFSFNRLKPLVLSVEFA